MPVVLGILLIVAALAAIYIARNNGKLPVEPAPAPDENPKQDAKDSIQGKQ